VLSESRSALKRGRSRSILSQSKKSPYRTAFSYWKLNEDDKLSCVGKVVDSFAAYEKKYISNTFNVQVVDSLDSFYSDPRNRRIKMAHAVSLVVNGSQECRQTSWRG